MNLLLDENLSPRLVPRLVSLFSGLKHVREVGLKESDDKTSGNNYSVITTDFDFVGMSRRLGSPPKVIHIERCDFPFIVIEELLRRSAVLISEFDKDEAAGLLTVRVPSSGERRQ